MKTVIIKYNAGNIQSVIFALNRFGIEPIVSDDKKTIATADKVIFPGVGEAGSAMKYLKEKELDVVIKNLKQPVLGICIGLQLMCKHSEEGNADCVGIFEEHITKFPPNEKVPHMGWNSISGLKDPLFNNIDEHSFVYFVHSYYAPISPYTIATSNYMFDFSAGLRKDNFYAFQFHLEKSGPIGEKIMKNFLDL